MSIIINAVFPTIVLLVLGNICRRKGFLAPEFWGAADKLTYFVLFPSLLLTKVSQVDLNAVNFAQLLSFIALQFTFLSALAYLIYRLTSTKTAQFSSIYQGITRLNSFIVFAVIEARWGGQALSMAALFAGIIIPIVNICCVTAFSLGRGPLSLKQTLLPIVKNPLILAALAGFVANQFPILMPQVLFNSLHILATAALPLALLSVGAAIRVKMLTAKNHRFTRKSLWLTSLASLVISPAVALLIAGLLGISGEQTHILVVFAAVPTATSAYILSKQLGGDAELMAALISLQTILSMLSLTAWLVILNSV